MNTSVKFVYFSFIFLFFQFIVCITSFAQYDSTKDPGLKAVRELQEKITQADNIQEKFWLQRELDALTRAQRQAEKKLMSTKAVERQAMAKLQRQLNAEGRRQRAQALLEKLGRYRRGGGTSFGSPIIPPFEWGEIFLDWTDRNIVRPTFLEHYKRQYAEWMRERGYQYDPRTRAWIKSVEE